MKVLESVGKEDQMSGVIFIMRQVQEKHQAKKKAYYAFLDLEKAFDRVPREVVRWALCNWVWLSGSSAQLWHCKQRIAL